jgi:hypothetical protein
MCDQSKGLPSSLIPKMYLLFIVERSRDQTSRGAKASKASAAPSSMSKNNERKE